MYHLPAGSSRPKPDSDAIVRLAIPLLVHVYRTKQRSLTVFDQSGMHGPVRIVCVASNVHDYLSQASPDAAFFHGFAKAVETIPVGKLGPVSFK